MTEYIPYDSDDEMLRVDSSYFEVLEFTKTLLHRDFQREVQIRIDALTQMLDDTSMKYNGRDYDVFRGGKRALREVQNIFHDILKGMEEVREEEIGDEK